MARPHVGEGAIVSLDGPISIGKTTLGTIVCKRLGEQGLFFPETGHKTTGAGENPVDVWLENPKELSAPFQMSMYCQCQARMLLAEKEAHIARLEGRSPLIVIDRSLIGNAVFAETNYRIGNMTRTEFRFYCTHLVCEPVLSLSATGVNVQLWAPVDTCIERLKVRGASDTTAEEKKYQKKYFWELARTTFCALLSNLSKEQPHPQLVINWDVEAERAADRFCNVYNDYVRIGRTPLSVHLSHDPTDDEYMHFFDYSHLETPGAFFSRAVISNVMDAISLRDTYDGPRRVFIRLPRCVERTTFSEIFPLTIL